VCELDQTCSLPPVTFKLTKTLVFAGEAGKSQSTQFSTELALSGFGRSFILFCRHTLYPVPSLYLDL
jgi:hypothetical protein